MIKVFLFAGFMVFNPETETLEQESVIIEMGSMEECQARLHQEEFTGNIAAQFPGAVFGILDCQEVMVDREV